MDRPLVVGAVMYDPKVSVIWDIIRDFFESQSCPIDVAFYSTYELQVAALLDRTIDVAWNSPLAWLDAQRQSGGTCRAIAMRDTDCDRVSYFVARRDGPVRTLSDLRNRTLATGAIDSPQATLIPLGRLRRDGLDPAADLTVRRFDVLVGKHGDHVGGERDAFECLRRGEAAACAMLDLNWDGWTKDGTIDAGPFHHRRRDRSLRSLRLHGPPGSRGRHGAALAGRAVRDAIRQSRPPGNDGSRRAEGVAARPDERLRAIERSRRRRAFLRAGSAS